MAQRLSLPAGLSLAVALSAAAPFWGLEACLQLCSAGQAAQDQAPVGTCCGRRWLYHHPVGVHGRAGLARLGGAVTLAFQGGDRSLSASTCCDCSRNGICKARGRKRQFHPAFAAGASAERPPPPLSPGATEPCGCRVSASPGSMSPLLLPGPRDGGAGTRRGGGAGRKGSITVTNNCVLTN